MEKKDKSPRVKDISAEYQVNLVRTQVYLADAHRRFLANESKERGISMAELLREWIDEKMNPENDSWERNSLLENTPEDPSFEGHEDGSTNSDRYIYGSVEK
jgi:hypothetical protein